MSARHKVINAEGRFGKGRRLKPTPKLDELFEKDLARSGIDLKTAKKVGLKVCDTAELWAALNPRRADEPKRDFTAAGYVFTFFTPEGKTLGSFIRARKLAGDWSDDDDGRWRYNQPVNTAPHLYVPAPIMRLPKPDPETGKIRIVGELLVVEGEKKAIKANMCGIPAVALAGVWNFTSAKFDIPLLDEFKRFDLSDADIVVSFDRDVFDNEDVQQAKRRFSFAIRREHQPKSVREVRLTGEAVGGKLALDDWLATFDDPSVAKAHWQRLERIEDRVGEAFATYNAEIAYVLMKKKYFDIPRRVFFPSQTAVVEQYGTGALANDGKRDIHPINLWLKNRNPSTTAVHDVVYAPGKASRFRADKDQHETLNLWRPSTMVPVSLKTERDVAPFLEFLEYLTPSLKESERDTLLDGLAYPLQHLGAKVRWAPCLVSPEQGVGKTTLGRILIPMYGAHNAWQIDGSSLVSNFNRYAQSQFVIVNEIHAVTYAERKQVMESLKTLITDDVIDFHQKYIDQQNIPNHLNLFFTSNHEDALMLDEHDRRYFVIRATAKKWKPIEFKKLNDWLEHDDGYALVYGYLMKRDLSNFDPNAAPPRTEARSMMIQRPKGALADLIKKFIDSPEDVLSMGKGKVRPDSDLFEPQHIVECLLLYAHEKHIRFKGELTVKVLGAALKGQMPRRRIRGRRGRGSNHEFTWITLYAVFNPEQWRKREKSEWRNHWKQSQEAK
jgi:hypothetical protein